MRAFLLALAWCCIGKSLFAQISIRWSGEVFDLLGKPVAGASIRLRSTSTHTILQFTRSDSQGRFGVQAEIIGDTLQLEVTKLGFAIHRRSLLTQSEDSIRIVLTPESKPLPEVSVKAKGIYQQGDTVNYAVSAFIRPVDQVIGDVLRRMPGIEIQDDGRVLYQGVSINRYYIEGLNLLDDRYQLANQNIPAEAVQSVQVWEKHQPIRVLDSVAPSNAPAINIKLKKDYRSKLIGRSKWGIGASPWLGLAEWTPMQFRQKAQYLAIYKFNNLGFDRSSELRQFGDAWSNDLNRLGVQNGPTLSIPFPQTPLRNLHRNLFNQQHVASVNRIKIWKKQREFKWQLDGWMDRQRLTASQDVLQFLPGDTVRIQESNRIQKRMAYMNGKFNLVRNQPGGYTEWLLSGGWQYSRNRATLQQMNSTWQQQNFEQAGVQAAVHLIRTRRSWVHDITGFLGWQQQPERLLVWPGLYPELLHDSLAFDGWQQQSRLRSRYARFQYQGTRKWRGLSIQQRVETHFRQQPLRSELVVITGMEKELVNGFSSDNTNQEWQGLYEITTNLKWSKWMIGGGINTQVARVWTRSLAGRTEAASQFWINPTISVMRSWPRGWMLTGMYYQMPFLNEPFRQAQGPIFTDFRRIADMPWFLKYSTMQHASFRVEHRKLETGWYMQLSLMHQQSKSNALQDLLFSGVLARSIQIERHNAHQLWNASALVRKYVSDWRASFSTKLSHQQHRLPVLSVGKLQQFAAATWQAAITANANQAWWSADYELDMRWIRSGSTATTIRNASALLTQVMAISIHFPKRWTVQQKGEHQQFWRSNQPQASVLFWDMEIRKRFARWDLSITADNLLNQQQFDTWDVSPAIERRKSFLLRPRQVWVAVSFNLN